MICKKKIFILLLLLLGCIHLIIASDVDGVFVHKVGQFEVVLFVEAEREGNATILNNLHEDMIEQYIPKNGFLHSTNVFLVKTPEQIYLVDSGTGAQGAILEKIVAYGIEPSSINAVLLSHLHFDHFGGLQSEGVANFPNAKIYISENELEHFTKTNINEMVVTTLSLYEDRIVTFHPNELYSEHQELFNGIFAIANYGHTPGHVVYLLESEGEKLVIAGDFLHVGLVQFQHPEISAIYDIDPYEAAVSRRQILEYATQHDIPIGGMHIVYPGMGTVEKEGDGFKFLPFK